eukprot:1582006-Pyramimonas_sp.AAC.1
MSESCCQMTLGLAMFLVWPRPCFSGILKERALWVQMRMSISWSLEVPVYWGATCIGRAFILAGGATNPRWFMFG